jgi:hypothetical protein
VPLDRIVVEHPGDFGAVGNIRQLGAHLSGFSLVRWMSRQEFVFRTHFGRVRKEIEPNWPRAPMFPPPKIQCQAVITLVVVPACRDLCGYLSVIIPRRLVAEYESIK